MTTQEHDAPEEELRGLAGIARFFHWWEEFLNIVSGPVLLFGLAIALVDLLTDGRLTATSSVLIFAWAISQALGIDVQLMGSASRVRHAHGWARMGWIVVLIPLAYAAWQAGDVFAVQQAQHIAEAAALAQLGMSVTLWLGWRAALAVGLVILNGLTRYRAPRKVQPALSDERADLERELELEPLRQRLRAQQVGGWRAVAQVAWHGGEAPVEAPAAAPAPDAVTAESLPEPASFTLPERPDQPPDEPPDGGLPPDRPAAPSGPVQPAPTPLFTSQSAPHPRRTRKSAAVRRRERAAAEALERERRQHAYALLDEDPQMTPNALARALHCRWRTAYSYVEAWHRLHDERDA